MKKISIYIILILVFSGNILNANPILTERYKEADRLVEAMKMIEKEMKRIKQSKKRRFLTSRIWEYQSMLTQIKKRLKEIVGLARYNFIDFNLHTISKLRNHFYGLMKNIKAVHMLDSSQKIIELLNYSIQQFLDLFNHVKDLNGPALFKALEDKVFQKLVSLYGKNLAKNKLNELHALFTKLEKDIFGEVIEIVRFISMHERPVKDFARQYETMTSEQRLVYVTANKEIIDVIVQTESYIETNAINLFNSKTKKPMIDEIVELIKKYYPQLLSSNFTIMKNMLAMR